MLTETDSIFQRWHLTQGSVQGQTGQESEQTGVAEDAHCRGLGLGDILQSFPTQSIKKYIDTGKIPVTFYCSSVLYPLTGH